MVTNNNPPFSDRCWTRREARPPSHADYATLFGPIVRNGKIPNSSEAISVNRAVQLLASELGMETSPTPTRYLDKVLMEISRQGLI